MEELIKLLDYAYNLEINSFNILERKVDFIISNRITDINTIESTLDSILDYMFIDTRNTFYKLNDYYETINQENSNDYKLIYKEFRDYD